MLIEKEIPKMELLMNKAVLVTIIYSHHIF